MDCVSTMRKRIFVVPACGWKAMFVVGLVAAVLMIPLRWFEGITALAGGERSR